MKRRHIAGEVTAIRGRSLARNADESTVVGRTAAMASQRNRVGEPASHR